MSAAETGLKTNQHGADTQRDTFLTTQYKAAITPYVGAESSKLHVGWGGVNAQVGPRIWWAEHTFWMDESQGGGQFEQKTEDKTVVGPAFGIEYNLPFSGIGNLALGFDGLFQVGFWGEDMPGGDIRLTTNTFNINYTAEMDDGWLYTVRWGLGIRF